MVVFNRKYPWSQIKYVMVVIRKPTEYIYVNILIEANFLL